jgi:hypothetical protein
MDKKKENEELEDDYLDALRKLDELQSKFTKKSWAKAIKLSLAASDLFPMAIAKKIRYDVDSRMNPIISPDVRKDTKGTKKTRVPTPVTSKWKKDAKVIELTLQRDKYVQHLKSPDGKDFPSTVKSLRSLERDIKTRKLEIRNIQ